MPTTLRGLSSAEARSRLLEHGPNALASRPRDPLWRRFLRQFRSPLIYILIVALAFDVAVWLNDGGEGLPVEGMAIALILLLNAALGLYQEQRSEAALTHLQALAASQVWALRDGQLARVPSHELVPGDRVRLEAGDRIPADGTLAEVTGGLVDESVLTGESVPVDKQVGDDVMSGTLLVRGLAWLDIGRTGPASAMGRLATMIGNIQVTRTPLERRVDRLGNQIARWILLLAAVILVGSLLAEGVTHVGEMVLFAVALAVAAVPEGLPAVLTVALALGVERMARHHAVVRRLAAVEALGSVTVIATDKTGTLTENRMDVRAVEGPRADEALRALVLANDADFHTQAGDPLELGLLRYAAEHGVDAAATRQQYPRVGERPFDSAWKFQRVTVRNTDPATSPEPAQTISYLKGAPEVLLARCEFAEPKGRQEWAAQALEYASQGYRVLAAARGTGESEDQLQFLGVALFWDPPRAEVPGAVRAALDAGIRVVMITGDHPATALAIARQIGIAGERHAGLDDAASVVDGAQLATYDESAFAAAARQVNVFARVQPDQKLRLVEALQAAGEIVAMTGDGVNDAPALKRSDVGVAMGQRGSDVSREVADLVLLDDNFATIVGAVDEGRGIYENIQKFLRFLFSTNLSEILLITLGAVFAYALNIRDDGGSLLLPLTASQILWINLATDGLPALALALDRNPGVMQQPPRPATSPLLDRESLRFIIIVGTMKAALSLALLGLVPWLGFTHAQARASAFHTMAIGQLLLTYPSRHTSTFPLPNPYLHAAVFGGIVIQVAAGWIPATARLLGDAAVPLVLWATIFATAALAWLFAEATARLVWKRRLPR